MKLKYIILSVVVVLSFVLTAIVYLSIVPASDEKDCIEVKGVVASVYEGGAKDIVFTLQGQKRHYYINRGLEQGLTIGGLRKELTGKEVLIKYPDYWAALNPAGSIKHISKLYFNGKVLYSEID